ncbi:unnamed protein product [Dracunculus medinensis]|uniref:Uncharacterized protein n=1 Tax=Dracunculus medinensis TaxID=318479 RepID=A0A0N4U4B3_DRAME|nr:unnamed protein product [Dracunculus medinensis]
MNLRPLSIILHILYIVLICSTNVHEQQYYDEYIDGGKGNGHSISMVWENDQVQSKHKRPVSAKNCTSDTAVIDKLLIGTGYSKFRLPG